MNHSMYSADRMTHLKIVVVALIAGTMVAGIGVASRMTADTNGSTRLEAQIPVIKAGQPVIVSKSDTRAVR